MPSQKGAKMRVHCERGAVQFHWEVEVATLAAALTFSEVVIRMILIAGIVFGWWT